MRFEKVEIRCDVCLSEIKDPYIYGKYELCKKCFELFKEGKKDEIIKRMEITLAQLRDEIEEERERCLWDEVKDILDNNRDEIMKLNFIEKDGSWWQVTITGRKIVSCKGVYKS